MDKIIADLKHKIELFSLPEGLDIIPEYVSIKTSKENLYNKYSSVVQSYNRVCDSLAKLHYMLVTVDRLLKELPNSNEVFSRQKLFSTELKNMKEEIKGIAESYKYMKEGLEAAVRFYNSIQYILTSFRLEDC